jgi:molybdenum cofactor cytidylyltransferase
VKQVAAILLAAGQSRRMGAFKPLLPFGNQTVIDSCIRNLRSADIEDIVVIVGHRASELTKHLQSQNVRIAVNPDPESEMAESIARGVEQINHASAILIALADHPAVSSDTIKTIVAEWERGARMVQPEHEGHGGHPVLIDSAFRGQLLSLDPQNGLRSFFKAHRDEVRRLPVASPYIARDMDTWEDYVALHQEAFGRPPQPN